MNRAPWRLLPAGLFSLRNLRFLGVALVFGATVGCGSENTLPLEVDPEFSVFLNVILKNNEAAGPGVLPTHIFRDVLDTFGPHNRIAPGDSLRLPEEEIDGQAFTNWVAGRNGVPRATVQCQAPGRGAQGSSRRHTVRVVWNGTSLTCVGWPR